jgi:hypothetical protein
MYWADFHRPFFYLKRNIGAVEKGYALIPHFWADTQIRL